MGTYIKKEGHSQTCHNNCRIHHNPDFFSYYQYPYSYSPFYPYSTPPSVVQYTLPQNLCPPLLTQYHYSPIIQQPIPSQQLPQGSNFGQHYQNFNHDSNINSFSNSTSVNAGPYSAVNDNPHNFHPNQQLNDYYPWQRDYNASPPEKENYYSDFRRPVSLPSVEEEYNWAVHISEILDEFISRNRHQSKTNVNEYKELKSTLDTSLSHLKEAEALNKTLVDIWEKRDDYQKPSPTVTSTQTVILSENPLAAENKEENGNQQSPISDLEDSINTVETVEPEVTSPQNPLLQNNDFDFLDLDNDLDDVQDDGHSVLFDKNQFNTDTTTYFNEPPANEKQENIVPEDLNDFFDVNAPVIDLDTVNVVTVEETMPEQDLQNSTPNGVPDTGPTPGTYQNYTIKTFLGKVEAKQIYEKMFDEFGHNKIDQFQIMNEFGLTEKQYDKLVNNFYQIKKENNKKIKKEQFGVVIQSKFNAKAFWISITIIGIILLLIGIVTILYFTVPTIANEINIIFEKIRDLF
ncbi:hypothetical protein [Spiroplasma endosymbiont of Stenodema calcarata]|uniref:hypothetical protein n=1 Tax=Spiroplasma endosymbiont of Stenodema calcarata TaxID=3139328 RepID=UPI003CCB6BC1